MPRVIIALLFVLTCASRAVTLGDGPGGVGTTDGASELELWLQADALGLANGAAVAEWPDSSGNGRNLVQGNAGRQPVLVTSALGGKPVVRFTTDFFGPHSLPSSNNEFTIVAVVKPASVSAYQNIIDGAGNSRPMLWVDGVGNYEFNLSIGGAVTPATGGYDVIFAVKRSTGPQFSQVYRNGALVTASGPTNFTIPESQTYSFFNRGGFQQFSGDVAELIVYSTALTENEVKAVGYYLQEKYSLATDFPPPGPMFKGYTSSPAVYGINSPISPNSPNIVGGSPTEFSISPSLPAGLVFNTATGVISGTPTAVSPETVYTVTANFVEDPPITFDLQLSVTQPTIIGYESESLLFTRNRPVIPRLPLTRGGPFSSFSIEPALPAGLTFDSNTGAIQGTPTATAESALYTVTAFADGYPSTQTTVSLQVVEFSGTLDITEFMAANSSTIADGNGEYSDWIEIHNYGSIPIDVGGWSLTDNAANLRKWVFPSRVIEPGGYLLVFASGESRVDPVGYLHSSLKLSAEGEYLALVRPDESIAREFAPAFPPQPDDVSYGTNDRITYGAYSLPTPGAENGFFSSVSSIVTASPSGRAFAGTLNVTLSAPLESGAVIRYTLDGTQPSAISPVYSAPLALTQNTRLRARVFRPGLNPGPETNEVYMKLAPDVASFSSNLPLVFLSTDGPIAPTSSKALTGANAIFIDVDGETQRASATGAPNFAGRSGMRVRGRSSASFPQKQFKFTTYNRRDKETDYPLLGLPEASDWVLYAPYTDKSLIRNALAYSTWEKLGWPSLSRRFVEVFINDTGANQFSYASHYAGVYMLVEPVKLESIGLDKPQNTTSYSTITGGFINETGNADSQDYSTNGSGRAVAHAYSDPDIDKLNTVQQAWLRDRVTDFESALYGSNFQHPGTGQHYSKYTNPASHVDYKIVREWSRNFDGGSTYFHIPRGGVLTMGPLWDYNWAFGNVNYAEGGDLPGYFTSGWNRSFTAAVNGWAPWWLRLEEDPDWWQKLTDRWAELREGVLSNAAVNAEIDALTTMLGQEAAGRNFARWPQLGEFTVVSPPGYETRTTYQSEVDYLKNWIQDRSAWIDSQFLAKPVFSQMPGTVSPGTLVTMTAGPGQTIYYTTNGEDPRAPGGTIKPGALSVTSGGGVIVNSSIILTARVREGSKWSAPTKRAYIVGTPASALNLVISEINYHPADPTPAELSVRPDLGDDDFEFVEIRNLGGTPIDLTGAAFVEGINYVFPPGSVLAPGAYYVVAEDAEAFALRYGFAPQGVFSGNLSNSGETVRLCAADGAVIASVTYSDSWSEATDGRGYTLALATVDEIPAEYSSATTWRVSGSAGGTPGEDNGTQFTAEFGHWRYNYFSPAELNDPARSGRLADPDQDGYPNILEFALNTDPLDSGSRPTPVLEQSEVGISLTFVRPRLALDVAYMVETSTDLLEWTQAVPPLTIVSETDETTTMCLSLPFAEDGSLFLRVHVTHSGF